MRTTFIAYLTTLASFLLLDMAWLMLYAVDMFQRELGGLLRTTPSYLAIMAFYLVFGLALTVLVVVPELQNGSLVGVAWRSALFGLAAYATYDLTNFATLKDWTLALALKDLAWGTIASTIAGTCGYLVASSFR